MGVLWAPIIGEFSGKLYRFMPLDIGETLPFPNIDHEVYLRTFSDRVGSLKPHSP
jgi:hypothetical protein